ncbi:hypothetical protein [Streptomyces sp. NPDC101234]|uniref:hypothetical protein n=1 Tax=Streptomyces sp. NPDC101234 TaxID=3366138 RepID=UPI00381B9DFF
MVAHLLADDVRHAVCQVTVQVRRLDEVQARDAGGSGLGPAVARDIAVVRGGA